MYQLSGSDEGMTRLCWDNSRKVFVYGTASGEIVCAHSEGSRTSLESGVAEISYLAINNEGSKCAIAAADDALSEYDLTSTSTQKDADSLLNGVKRPMRVTHMQYDSNGSNLFLSTLSPGVDIISLKGEKTADQNVKSGDGGTRTFALTSDDSLIAVVDTKGKVTIFGLSKQDNGLSTSYPSNDVQKTFHGLVADKIAIQVDDALDMGCRLSWSPTADKRILAVPSKQGSCVLCYQDVGAHAWNDLLLSSDDLDLSHALTTDLNIASFSPDGHNLATCDTSGVIIVWKIDSKNLKESKPVNKFEPSTAGPLLDLVWGQNEGENCLLASSRKGFAKIEPAIKAPVILSMPEPVAKVVEPAAMSIEFDNDLGGPAEPVQLKKLKKNAAARDGEKKNDEAENDFLANDTAPANSAPASVSARVQAPVSEKSTTPVKKTSSMPKNSTVLDKDKDDETDDSEAEEGDEPHDQITGSSIDVQKELCRIDDRMSALEAAKTGLSALHLPFQPSSTTNDDKKRRYLVWNSIGNITLREELELKQNRVEIRFADTMGRNKQEAFADTNDFVMAALSHEGAIFATPLEAIDTAADNFRKPKGSMIHYHAFPAQAKMHGANETFDLHLPDNEEVTNVAVGTGWCAVATSNGFLRIFSSTGVQTNVFWLKGPAVTLVGSGSQLAVFYNAGIPMEGTVQLRMDLYVLVWDRPGCNRCVASDQTVPLTKGSTLQWAGIEADESQCVCIVDSYGMVSMLMKPLGWQWMPVLDVNRVKKDPSHVWWPIGVRKDKFSYVQLSGESRPLIYPQPVVTTKPLRIPIAEVPHGKDKERIEAANLRLHELVWMQTMTAHKEVIKTEQDVFGLMPIEESSNETLEARYEKQQVEADKTVLKMLQEACRTHELAKAFDLAHKLRTMKALQAGKQIANKFGRPQVATKLDDLLEERFQQQQMQQQASDEFEESKAARSVPPPRTPSQYDGGSHHREDQPAKVVEIYQDTTVDDRESSHSVAVTPAEHQPFNPFKKAHHSPVKRKAGEYDVEDLKKMKSSPSPHKKPLLSRQSSFTETARSQKLSTNSFL